MALILYSFADSLFEIPPINEGEKHCVKAHIQEPRPGEAKRYVCIRGVQRINAVHPEDSENKVEGYVRDAREYRISERGECAAKRCIYRKNKHKQRDVERTYGAVLYRYRGISSCDKTDPEASREIQKNSYKPCDKSANSENIPK